VDKAQAKRCSYACEDGSFCSGPIEGEGQLCFWHDPTASKEGPDVKDRLQQWASGNRSLEGILLRYAQLEGIKLGGSKKLNLSHSDLFRANLKKARLTNVDLSHANLMRADLNQSRMNRVKITDANLIGLQLRGARLDRVDWGKAILHEQQGSSAERKGDENKASQSYREALAIYQHLSRVYERNRNRRMTSWLYLKEMEVERKLMPRRSMGRTWSGLIALVCGYGEKPLRMVGVSLIIIVFCAILYSIFDVYNNDLKLGFVAGNSLSENAQDFIACLFYSATVFTSLGFSERSYIGITRFIASFEALVGTLSMAFFLVLLVRKRLH